jgi:hypothetical protein
VSWNKDRYANDPAYRAMLRAVEKAWRKANPAKVSADNRRRADAGNELVAEAHNRMPVLLRPRAVRPLARRGHGAIWAHSIACGGAQYV